MKLMKTIGEDGVSMSDNDRATRYNQYQVYLDLKELNCTNSKICNIMDISESDLNLLKNEFEG